MYCCTLANLIVSPITRQFILYLIFEFSHREMASRAYLICTNKYVFMLIAPDDQSTTATITRLLICNQANHSSGVIYQHDSVNTNDGLLDQVLNCKSLLYVRINVNKSFDLISRANYLLNNCFPFFKYIFSLHS